MPESSDEICSSGFSPNIFTYPPRGKALIKYSVSPTVLPNIFGSSSGIISNPNVEEIYIKCSGNLNLITGFEKFKKEKITDNLKKLKDYPEYIPDPEFILVINQP